MCWQDRRKVCQLLRRHELMQSESVRRFVSISFDTKCVSVVALAWTDKKCVSVSFCISLSRCKVC